MRHLKKLHRLNDLHILYPPPIANPHDVGHDQRKQPHLVQEIINPILNALPAISRFGLGRKSVWERSTGLVFDKDPCIAKGAFYDCGWEPVDSSAFGAQYAEGNEIKVDPSEGAHFVQLLERLKGIEASADLEDILQKEQAEPEESEHEFVYAEFASDEDDHEGDDDDITTEEDTDPESHASAEIDNEAART